MRYILLKDFPSFIRTMDENDIMLNFLMREVVRASRARSYHFEHV
jgi:hypothetical protein